VSKSDCGLIPSATVIGGLALLDSQIRTTARIMFRLGAWSQAASRFSSSKNHFVSISEKYIDRFETGVPKNSNPT